jgi:hypothetical protein
MHKNTSRSPSTSFAPSLLCAALLGVSLLGAPLVHAAPAGPPKSFVASRALAKPPAHLSSAVSRLGWLVMRDKAPKFDPAHDGATPGFEIHSSQLRLVRPLDYDRELHAVYEVAQLPADHKIHLTTLLPVSGHVGYGPPRLASGSIDGFQITSAKNENAAQFAKTNVYNMTVTHVESGATQKISGIRSTGIVTAHDLDIEMSQPGTYRVQFWPDGSAGVAGWAAARTIDLVRK